MSALYTSLSRKRTGKCRTTLAFLSILLILLMMVCIPQTAWAGGIGDVVTEVANNYFSSSDFRFGNEDVTGLNIKMHQGGGNFYSGFGGITVLGPANASEMQTMLSHVDSEANHTSIQSKKLKGCEVREYTLSNGAGVGVILPDYFVTIELYQSGRSNAQDIQTALTIAQQVLDGLERNGLLSEPAPQVDESSSKAEESPTSSDKSEATSGKALDEPVKVADTMNIAAVQNGPTVPSTITIKEPHLITSIENYHWNYAKGATPGTIALKDQNGKIYGPWQAGGRDGQGGVPNAYWSVSPNIVIPAGTYTVVDSDNATWSTNSGSGGKGMTTVLATPHFSVTDGEQTDNNRGTDATGQSPYSGTESEAPAGVGSVGNIPGPANTTEAVVGVAVPGLIATGLGALAGLGGGGGGFAPAGGAPLASGGSGPAGGTGGSYPGGGTPQSGSTAEAAQLGRRRRDSDNLTPVQTAAPAAGADDSIMISVAEGTIPAERTDSPEIFIDTTDMIDAAGTVTPGAKTGGPLIDDEQEGPGLIPPTPGVFVETAEEGAVLGRPGALIDGSAEESILIQNGQVIAGAESTDTGILIDTSALSTPAGTGLSDGREQVFYDGTDSGREQIFNDDTGTDREQVFNDDTGSGRETDVYDKEGFDRDGFDQNGFDKDGFDQNGFDKDGFDKDGFDQNGFDKEGFDKDGFNQNGFDKEGFDKDGFDQNGFDKDGFDKDGFDQNGFDKEGFDKDGFDQNGFDKEGFDKDGFDQNGFDKEGFDKDGFDQNGFDKEGFDKDGFNQNGFDKEGFDKDGFDQNGFDKEGFDKDGFDQNGFDKEGFDKDGFNQNGFDKDGFDRDGFNQNGFNKEGFDRDGFDQNGFDNEGYDRNGFDHSGFDREGYDVNGYNAKGFNRQGYDAEGYNAAGYDKQGFDREGWDADGYGRDGFNKNGYDREGFDKDGYDREGYNRDGYDRDGMQREGYDEDGYDKSGFNKDGYDRDGYDTEGFDYEGYNRSGYDPWGYDRQGYGKDGYHWSGYNEDGYDRAGRHWSENPYEGDSPFNVDTSSSTYNPFAEGAEITPTHEVEMDGEGNIIGGRSLADSWKPTKPALGEPYPRTVEKYGAKPWTDEPEVPEPVEDTYIPDPDTEEDTGVIGPEDPMNTLKHHDIGAEESTDVPDESSMPQNIPEEDLPENGGDIPADQQVETGDSNTFTYTDPETGETSTYEYEPGYTGPRHGDTQVLVGKADGQTYELKFNAVTGKWVNTESGNEFNPDDFDRWQNDLAEDKRQAAIDLEKMANREDANSKAIDQNLADWKKLEQMQKAADKYNIGTEGGPGDVDKAVEQLKQDMLDGKEIDREKMDRIRRVIGDRIEGKTSADTGERWEEVPWYQDIDSALKANAATAKEVITGEKEDGSTSWLGLGARIMITAATGGGAQVVLDGTLTVAEAMYRIKDEIDKGETGFRAAAKAMGLVVLGEEAGWLMGKAGGKFMGEMLERFPAFTNKAADLLETAILKVSAKNQMWSKALGFISKESAEETLDQINKRLVDIGGDEAAEGIIKTASGGRYGLSVADSFDDVSKAGKAALGSGDDMLKGAGKSASTSVDDVAKGAGKSASTSVDDIAKSTGKSASTSVDDVAKSTGKSASTSVDDVAKGAGKSASGSVDDVAKGAGKSASGSADDVAKGAGNSDDIARGAGQTATESGDDIAKGGGKAASDTSDDMAKGAGKSASDTGDDAAKGVAGAADSPKTPDGPDGPARSGDGGGDGPGDPGGRTPGGDDAGAAGGNADNLPLNRGARTPEEVLSDPAAVARAERTVQNNVKDFDNLPPARQQELINEQAIYDEYRVQAEERVWNLVDKYQRGEPLTVRDIMELKADPASMRTLKNLKEMDGLGSQMTQQEVEGMQRHFNETMDEYIHQPSYRSVEEHLHNRYPGADPEGIRCRSVRTPGTSCDEFNINTDNDVIAERLVQGPDGPEWVEIPKSEWEDVYNRSLAENSGFTVEEASRRFPDTDWENMDEATRFQEWANHHEEETMDQFELAAGRDFSNQRTSIIPGGGRPMIEATPEEIAQGVETVVIDGRHMRPSTGYEMVQKGQGQLLDSEQLSLMEQNKIADYWNRGSTPAAVMRNQTEAMEQLSKTAKVAQTVENSYRNMGYKVETMPANMQEAIRVINNNNLSPASRVAQLQQLGYESPDDFIKKVSSRIGAIRVARR